MQCIINFTKSSRKIINCHSHISFESRKCASKLTWCKLPNQSACQVEIFFRFPFLNRIYSIMVTILTCTTILIIPNEAGKYLTVTTIYFLWREKVQANWPTSCPTKLPGWNLLRSTFFFLIEYIPWWSANWCSWQMKDKMQDQDKD